MWLLLVAEYYGGDTYTGFLSMMIDNNYEIMNDSKGGMSQPERRIEDRAFKFSSVHCPSKREVLANRANIIEC